MQKIISLLVRILLFVLPVFVLPITTDPYDFNKQALLAVGILIILILLILTYIRTKTINFVQSPLTIPVVLFTITTLITFFVNTPNKAESLLYPNGTGTIILVAIWFMIIVNTVEVKDIQKYLNPLLASGAVLAVLALLQYFGVGANIFAGKDSWLSNKFWNPTGSPLILALFLLTVLPYGIVRVLQYARGAQAGADGDKSAYTKRLALFGAATGIITLTLALLVVSLFTNAKPILLPFPFGWAIAAEVMKGLQTAAFGVGLLNYLPAFTTGHTAAYNQLPFWNIRFGVSSSFILQLVTELGIAGLITYLIIISRFVRRFTAYAKGVADKTLPYNPMFMALSISLALIFIAQVLLPGNLLQTIVLFTLLGMYAKFLSNKVYTEKSAILFILISLAGVISVILASITIYRAYAAEVYLKMAFDAAQQKNTNKMYTMQQNAISSNPFVDKFHRFFSQTNLAFAIAVSQKKDINDTDKTNLAKLLAQAAQSGKNAIAVSPTNVQNWENLGGVYRAMIGAVQQADVWTVQSYGQAIRLDPSNPNLYLTVGGVYYSAKNYDTAIQNFLQAARLKPNYANAYYNLAAAYREKKEWANAAQAMQAAIGNLPANSEDRKKAEAELEEIKKNIPQQPNDATNGRELQDVRTDQQITTPVNVPDTTAPNDVIRESPRPSAAVQGSPASTR